MQSVSSRIWTRVAVFISYDDNHYTTGTYYANIKHGEHKNMLLWVEQPVGFHCTLLVGSMYEHSAIEKINIFN